MTTKQAVYYGQIELIPGIICDGYVLNDGTAVMSERGTADLLGMDQKTLKAMRGNWPPKTLKPFIDKGQTMRGNFVNVDTKNSPYYGRQIVVYPTKTIQLLIHSYASAFINDGLRKNQIHIGKRSVTILMSLVQTALDVAIKQACGLSPNIQQTAQQNYVELVKQFGFTCSFENEIATKKDIINFLNIPASTLNSFLKKRQDDIQPIKLDYQTIKANGGTASRMNGYGLEDVSKIALGMDSVIGIELKKQAFGNIGTIVKPNTKGEIEWQQVLAKVFKGFGFQHNYTIGKYRVDFFVKDLMLVLECNGYDNHQNYDQIEEAQREKYLTRNYNIVRFHHKIGLEALFNGILQAKLGKVVRLYDVEHICPNNIYQCST
ncbi:DUF559 domain-containing protein [Candidatus Halobeggiatoa sp. HSG11]|nr:DUF559 domain-containing protein [Candidatus Halobeggiatoa sp. HSG11]